MYHPQLSTTELPVSQPPHTAAAAAAAAVLHQPMSQPLYPPAAQIHHTFPQPLPPAAVQFHHAASRPLQPPGVQIHHTVSQPLQLPSVQIHHAVYQPLQPPGVQIHPTVSQPPQQAAIGFPQSSSSVTELQVAKVEEESNPTSVTELLTTTEQQDQSNNSSLDRAMYKNKLQQYAQRSAMTLPVYHTVNEGFAHAPQFRSTVLIGGAAYTPTTTTLNRKTAEQAAAKLAMESIMQKIKEEGCPHINEDTVFCKSILNEYAAKVNLVVPPYTTAPLQGKIPLFFSSLVFNGVTYTGSPGKNKKEAEQLAARAVLLSILGSGTGTVLSEIINSKGKLYAELHGEKDSYYANNNIPPFPTQYPGNNSGTTLNKDKEVEVVAGTNYPPYPPTNAFPEGQVTNVTLPYLPGVATFSEGQATNVTLPYPPGVHQFTKPKPEPSADQVAPPIVFVQPGSGQPFDAGLVAGRKRRKNKKKANKKQRTDAQEPETVVPLNQVPPCSVAQ